MKTKIYLDYNASSPLHPESRAAMEAVYDDTSVAYNASAVHYFGREGRKIVENARTQVAALVGAQPNMLIFNSGATEGNNTILHHFAREYPDDAILISAIEHPSLLEAQQYLPNVKTIPVDENGLLDMAALETLLQETRTSLVSCMMVNNETGSIQNVSEISALTHKHGALFHTDATQAAGRISVNMATIGADFITLSAHKIGGPQGVGALAIGLCGQNPALLYGGGQEKRLRAGTENVAGIAGFGAAAHVALDGLTEYGLITPLRDQLENGLKTISPDITIHCEHVPRVANTTFFSLPGANAQSMLMALDLENIAVSNGSACSSGTVKPSAVLKAMGCDEKTASSALRISIGWATKKSDIDAFLDAWERIYSRIKR